MSDTKADALNNERYEKKAELILRNLARVHETCMVSIENLTPITPEQAEDMAFLMDLTMQDTECLIEVLKGLTK